MRSSPGSETVRRSASATLLAECRGATAYGVAASAVLVLFVIRYLLHGFL